MRVRENFRLEQDRLGGPCVHLIEFVEVDDVNGAVSADIGESAIGTDREVPLRIGQFPLRAECRSGQRIEKVNRLLAGHCQSLGLLVERDEVSTLAQGDDQSIRQ